MNAVIEQRLLSKIKTLSPPQVAQVEDFVEFLAAKSQRQAALGQLLAIAPALEAAGAEPMSEEAVAAEIDFSKGQRGQFFRPGTKLNLPVYLDAPLQARLAALAEARGVEFSIFINELLKKDLELIDTTR